MFAEMFTSILVKLADINDNVEKNTSLLNTFISGANRGAGGANRGDGGDDDGAHDYSSQEFSMEMAADILSFQEMEERAGNPNYARSMVILIIQ